MWGSSSGGDSAHWELSKENVQPLRQGRRVDVLNTSLQSTGGDEQTAQKVAEQRRTFELEIRTYSGDDPLSPWHQYVLWMEQHCPRGGHEGNLDGLLTQCVQRFAGEARYHQDPRFVALVIKQALSSQQTLETFRTMFKRHIGTQLAMFYRAWSAQLEITGNTSRADTVLAEGERLGAQPAEELAEARRKLQTRVASAVAAGRLPNAAPAQIGRGVEERHALGALRGSSDGAVPRQRVGSVQAGRPGTLSTAPTHQQPRPNQRLNVFVDENAAPAAPAPAPAAHGGGAELAAGRAAHKENVRMAGPWGEPQKAAKRQALAGGAAPAFRVYEDSGQGAANGSPITVKPGALAARAAPAPALDNVPVAHFEPPNDKVKAMYCKDLIYAGAGEVSIEELRAARWLKNNKALLEQRLMYEEMRREMQEMRREMRKNEAQERCSRREMQEMQRKNEALERQVQELKSRPAQTQGPGSLHGSLGLSNASGGSSSLHGHSQGSLSASGLVLASPTVNTRDAMNAVRDMFNGTVDTSVQGPRLAAGMLPPAAVPFTVYEEPESVFEPPPPPPAAAAQFSVYQDPEPAAPAAAAAPAQKAPPAAPFAVYEDAGCEAPEAGEQGDSDQENRPPAGCPPPPPRRRPENVLLDAVDIATEPLEAPVTAPALASAPAAVSSLAAAAAAAAMATVPAPAHPAAPASTRRTTMQFDDELTGFVPISEDVTFANGDLSGFAAAAGRVASTPFVPPAPVGAAVGGRVRRDTEEEGEFTANLKSVTPVWPANSRTEGGVLNSRTDGGGLTPIMEQSREKFKSSSSSSGSDASRQSRGDYSVPASGHQWRQRAPSGPDRSSQHLSRAAPPAPHLTQSSGYLGDRSGSVRPPACVTATDRSMSRRPDAGELSELQAPDVSMARSVGPAECSALQPAELSEKAAELSLVPAAGVSGVGREASSAQGGLSPLAPPAELSVFQPPAEFSPLQPPAEMSHQLQPPPELSHLQPPPEMSHLQPPPELSHLQPPATLSPAQPPAELSAFPPPAELSPAQPPPELSAFQPPPELSVVQPPPELSPAQLPPELSAFPPPAELSPAQPPPELSALQPPPDLSPAQPPSAALSSLTLEDPAAPAAPAAEHPDPWDAEIVAGLLSRLQRPIHTRERYSRVAGKLPNFKAKEVEIDGQRLAITLIGEGAYARVYHALDRASGEARCLKVQPASGGDWEFYALDELRERLAGEGEQPPFLMSVERMTAFDTGTVLCSEYEPAGSLLNVYNKYAAVNGKFDQCLAMLFTAEMLGAVAAVHGAGMVHGDVKPDNFLLRGWELDQTSQLVSELRSSGQPQLLQLIDFGRAIDLTLLPPGTTFTRVVTTDDFTCPEMKEGRQWTYQPDLYGVAASAHVLLLGRYLKLARKGEKWGISETIRRFWSPVWAEFFTAFLNIPSCSDLPDLAAWRRRFLALALEQDVTGVLKRLAVALKQR